ncbi:helix-turn-helix domain-containing protein [Nocardia sp. NPDC046763]|uniref:TetR/AcrR family transcriptional regulator n=1 Tax=Nocardia sp. NPDC046763 TaxID=3155256 RepID=UPI00340FCE77
MTSQTTLPAETTQRRSDATRTAILEAARRRFAEDGFHKATIRAIAADAGIDPSMVMRYSGSKDGLFDAALDIHRPGTAGSRCGRTGFAGRADRAPVRGAVEVPAGQRDPADPAALDGVCLQGAVSRGTSTGGMPGLLRAATSASINSWPCAWAGSPRAMMIRAS